MTLSYLYRAFVVLFFFLSNFYLTATIHFYFYWMKKNTMTILFCVNQKQDSNINENDCFL